MQIRDTILLAVGLTGLVAASCTANDPAAVSTVPISTVPVTTSTTVLAATTEPPPASTTAPPFVETDYDVSVVSEGSEPRFVVAPAAAEETNARLVYDTSRLITVQLNDDPPQPELVFASSLPIDLHIVDRTPTGFRLRTTFGAVEVVSDGGADSGEFPAVMESIEGLWFEETHSDQLTNRHVVGGSILGDATTTETMDGLRETLSLAQLPLPSAPLGLGAIWTSASQLYASGLPATLNTRATITDIGDGFARADIQIELRYLPGEVVLEGTQATVNQGSALIEGVATWTATSPLGLYEIVGTTSINLALTEADGSQTVIIQSVEETSVLQVR